MNRITSINGKVWAIRRKPRANADEVVLTESDTSWLIPYGAGTWDLYQTDCDSSVGVMSTNDPENVRKLVELMSQENVP